MASQRKLFRVRLETEAYREVEVEAYDAEDAAERAFAEITDEHWLAKDETAIKIELVERA